jgi:two-component system, OmpR family, phosphate regulon sensor histidine kinase PhoR
MIAQTPALLQTIIESLPDGLIATDNNGLICLVNKEAQALFGIDGASLLGQPFIDAPFHPPLRTRLAHAIRLISGGPPKHGQNIVEFTLPGDLFISCVLARVPDSQDGWVAVFQNITAFRRNEQARTAFVQTATHELRNPLGAVIGSLSMLESRADNLTTTQTEVLSIAMRGALRVQELVDEILDLERVEGIGDLRREPVDIPAMIEKCAIEMQPAQRQKSQQLSLRVDLDLPLFWGDERWLFRALLNLVSNASKYTPNDSTIIVRAFTRERSGGKELLIQVEDDGPGIPQEALPHIWDKFYRAPRHEGRAKGTGLGLSIVKTVVEKHSGYVFVNSNQHPFNALWHKRGSIFGMVMPYI